MEDSRSVLPSARMTVLSVEQVLDVRGHIYPLLFAWIYVLFTLYCTLQQRHKINTEYSLPHKSRPFVEPFFLCGTCSGGGVRLRVQ